MGGREAALFHMQHVLVVEVPVLIDSWHGAHIC